MHPNPAVLKWAPAFVGLVCCALLYQIATTRPMPEWISFFLSAGMEPFTTILLSIVLEALPFLLLGVVISAVLQLFVTEEMVRRLTPRNPILGIGFACSLGLFFPICECGMIPVVRRLMRKGMPAYIAAVFILAGPVLNPVTYASTYTAFASQPEMAYARMGLAFAVAATVGLILRRFVRRDPLRHSLKLQESGHAPHRAGLLGNILGHSSQEFFEMGKYLILGAGITALVQSLLPRESLLSIGQEGLSSYVFMAGFAYVLSLCSTSDAFVAASFSPLFSKGSLLTFLVLGPMVDFKGTLLLLSVFKSRFVLLLSVLTAAAVILGAAILGKVSGFS